MENVFFFISFSKDLQNYTMKFFVSPYKGPKLKIMFFNSLYIETVWSYSYHRKLEETYLPLPHLEYCSRNGPSQL